VLLHKRRDRLGVGWPSALKGGVDRQSHDFWSFPWDWRWSLGWLATGWVACEVRAFALYMSPPCLAMMGRTECALCLPCRYGPRVTFAVGMAALIAGNLMLMFSGVHPWTVFGACSLLGVHWAIIQARKSRAGHGVLLGLGYAPKCGAMSGCRQMSNDSVYPVEGGGVAAKQIHGWAVSVVVVVGYFGTRSVLGVDFIVFVVLCCPEVHGCKCGAGAGLGLLDFSTVDGRQHVELAMQPHPIPSTPRP
jgi:hypothetical protein